MEFYLYFCACKFSKPDVYYFSNPQRNKQLLLKSHAGSTLQILYGLFLGTPVTVGKTTHFGKGETLHTKVEVHKTQTLIDPALAKDMSLASRGDTGLPSTGRLQVDLARAAAQSEQKGSTLEPVFQVHGGLVSSATKWPKEKKS
jgi:hypothetical protein